MDSLHHPFSHAHIPLLPAGILLIASSLLGDYILLEDAHLWRYAAAHAYALLGFLIVDAALLVVILLRGELGVRLASLWGALQIMLMIADILTAPQFGFTYLEFEKDLYGYWAFDALLATRLLQALYPALASHLNYITERPGGVLSHATRF